MKKKIVSILTLLCMIIALLPTNIITVSAYTGTKYGDYLYYTVSDGEVTITECVSYAVTIEIPTTIEGYPVTSIGNSAFYYCDSLTSITIPDSVTSIGYRAFYACRSLTSIAIPSGVTSIGNSAFYYCDSLTSITIPNGVTSIGNSAFESCSSLTSVTIPSGVTCIGKNAFYWCNSLTSIAIPSGVTTIGNSAFESCSSLTSITIPDSVTSIGYRVFSNCGDLTSITIGNGVTSIGDGAFYWCHSLTSVTIPDSVTSIGDSAFESCSSLTSITIGNSVASIGSWAFYNTGFYKNDSNWESNVLYIGDYLIEAKSSLSGEYIVKNGTKCIAGSAFYSCDSLTSVTIPNSVTGIGESAFYNTGYYDNDSNWENDVLYIGDYLIKAKSSLSGECAVKNGTKCIASAAFDWCDSLTSVTIPNSVTGIDSYTFRGCTGLTSISIPNSVTSIGNGAFYNCTGLTSISIPNSVTSIGNGAFSYCSSLTNVYYAGSEADWNNILIDSGNDCLMNANITYIPKTKKSTKTTVSADGKSFAVKPENIANGNVIVIALYNGDKIIDTQSAVYGGADVTFNTNKSYTAAKVMVWNSLENMIPICDVEIVK